MTKRTKNSLKVKRTQLLQELESVKAGLYPKPIIEQSNCFIFKDNYLYTYNDELAYRRKSSLLIEGAIEAKIILKFLKNNKSSYLNVEKDEREIKIHGHGFEFIPEFDNIIRLPILSYLDTWSLLPEKFTRASGAVIRKALQQLEADGLVASDRNGRVISAKGRSLLDKVASKIVNEQYPELKKY